MQINWMAAKTESRKQGSADIQSKLQPVTTKEFGQQSLITVILTIHTAYWKEESLKKRSPEPKPDLTAASTDLITN